jgi:hypothetical protein
MAKKTGNLDFVDPPGVVTLPPGTEAVPPPVAAEAAPKPRWEVTLKCPTPLEFRTLVVDGENEAEAKKAFCLKNNISDSVCEWDIKRTA